MAREKGTLLWTVTDSKGKFIDEFIAPKKESQALAVCRMKAGRDDIRIANITLTPSERNTNHRNKRIAGGEVLIPQTWVAKEDAQQAKEFLKLCAKIKE
jgi:AICAR transformylase/IMP cyclohydrolase PurH